MATVMAMPNGTIVAVLTPREAISIHDQLLDPDRFPWQGTEQEMTAHGLKMQLYQCVLEASAAELQVATNMLVERVREIPSEDG